MKTITLHNKTFEVFIPETEISAIVHSMANQINNSGVKDPLFIAVMNGAFLFAADVMRKITIPNAEISFIKLFSYEGVESTGKANELIGICEDISGLISLNNSSKYALAISCLSSLIKSSFDFSSILHSFC